MLDGELKLLSISQLIRELPTAVASVVFGEGGET